MNQGYYEFRKQLHSLFVSECCDFDDIVGVDCDDDYFIRLVEYEQELT